MCERIVCKYFVWQSFMVVPAALTSPQKKVCKFVCCFRASEFTQEDHTEDTKHLNDLIIVHVCPSSAYIYLFIVDEDC